MNKLILALTWSAQDDATFAAAPADARHYSRQTTCTRWHNHRCISWKRLTTAQARHARYRVGYVFGPRYKYTAYRALPHTYVNRYGLNPNGRYVYSNGYIYVVDPATYAITRVLQAL